MSGVQVPLGLPIHFLINLTNQLNLCIKQKKYSYIAALFLFLTGFSHTFGTFMEIPKDQVEVLAGYEVMQKTIVPMPFGVGRSYAEIFLGTNLSVSLFLFLVGAVFILLAKDQLTKNEFKNSEF
jgi:hypothetical protein